MSLTMKKAFSVFELFPEIFVQEMFINISFSIWKVLQSILKKTNIFSKKKFDIGKFGFIAHGLRMPGEDFFSTIPYTIRQIG